MKTPPRRLIPRQSNKVAAAVKFKDRRWHKAGLTRPSLHSLKFNLSWERCHRSQGGTFNQSRLNSNAASQFEKREKYIKKGSNLLSWLFPRLKPLCRAASPGRLELEMWTFPPPNCKHGRWMERKDIVGGTEMKCRKGNCWCTGNSKAIKYPIKAPCRAKYLVGKYS